MKRILLLTVVFLLLSVNVGAITLDNYNLSIDLGGDYSVLTQDNISRNEEFVTALGHSQTSITQYFSDNSLVLFAANAEKTRQLQVICKQTEFSSRLGDMSYLSDDDALSFVNRFVTVKTVSDLTLVTVGDTKYYEIISTSEDSGGKYCSIQYVTVRGGKLYAFSFFENGTSNPEDFNDFALNIMSTVVISGAKRATAEGTENITEMIIIFLLIVLAAVVAGWVLVTLIRDIYKKSAGGNKILRRKH